MDEEDKTNRANVPSEKLSLLEFLSFKEQRTHEADVVCKAAYESPLKDGLIQLASVDHRSPGHEKRRISWSEVVRKVSTSIRVASAFAEAVRLDPDTLADDLLTGKATLEQLHDTSLDSEGVSRAYRTVQNVIEDYQGLYEEVFLLLNAPKGKERNSQEGLPYHHEKDARDIQLNTFYKVVVGSEEKDKYPSMPIIADNYDDICQGIECFLGAMACKAKMATIVYNGHGTTTGHLHLENEQSPPTNSKFLKDVHALWDQHKQKHQEDNTVIILPSKLTVVLAQCYGFIYSQEPREKPVVNVVALASPSKPKTTYRYEMGECPSSKQNYIERSVHFELECYARRRSEDIRRQSGTHSDLDIRPHANDSGASSRRDSEVSTVSSCEVLIPSLMVTCAMEANLRKRQTNEDEFLTKLKEICGSWKKWKRRTSLSSPTYDGVLAVARMSLDPSTDFKAPTKSPEHKSKCNIKGLFSKKKKSTPTLDTLAKSTFLPGALAPHDASSDSD